LTLGRFVPPNLPGLNSEANAVAPMSRVFIAHQTQDAQRVKQLVAWCSAKAGWDDQLLPPIQPPPMTRARKRVDEPAERVTLGQAAAILGLKHRKLQGMAQRGEIPGAAKIGRQWTFDLARLRRFVTQQENVTKCRGNERPRPEPTGAAKSSLAVLKFAGGFSDGRLAQMIRQSQKRVAKQGKREH
jgi:hypothetical protein